MRKVLSIEHLAGPLTIKISSVDSFREKLFTGGLSETASQLIPVCNDQVQYQYNSSWAQWVSWCNERKVDPFQCDINQVNQYSEDKSLCVVTTIDEYIKCIVNWREEAKTQ